MVCGHGTARRRLAGEEARLEPKGFGKTRRVLRDGGILGLGRGLLESLTAMLLAYGLQRLHERRRRDAAGNDGLGV